VPDALSRVDHKAAAPSWGSAAIDPSRRAHPFDGSGNSPLERAHLQARAIWKRLQDERSLRPQVRSDCSRPATMAACPDTSMMAKA
jgi:hypothetical protein